MQQRCALLAGLNPRRSTGRMGWDGGHVPRSPVALRSGRFRTGVVRCGGKSRVVPVEQGER